MTPALPVYDRARLTPGIVHIGLGNFHRAHLAVYMDDLMAMGLAQDWAILGAGVRPADAAMRQALLAQDCLSTVILRGPEGAVARRVGAMTGFVPVAADNAPLIAAMADPRIRIVSLTITEGGYFLGAGGTFDPAAPDILHDARHPDRPRTAFGAILAALVARRAAGVAPFTVMSCDNLPGNGRATAAAVTGLAALRDRALAAWVAAEVAFPNGMVDRITPATDDAARALARSFGLDDPVPVTCEPFRHWVLEDRFPQGRPPWERVGVTFTTDVHAHETMKIRILNGAHAVIAYPAALMDIGEVAAAMAHPLIRGFLRTVAATDILPVVPPVPGVDLGAYLDLVMARFANPGIADTIRRLCVDGANRQPKFIVPSIRDNLAAGRVPEGLILLSALWCRYCAGVTDSGAVIAPEDAQGDALRSRARAAQADPAAWLAMETVYGATGRDPRVQASFARHMADLAARGTVSVLRDVTG